MNRFLKTAASLLLTTQCLMASSVFQLNINDETIDTSVDLYLNNNFHLSNSSNYYLSLGTIVTEDETDKINTNVYHAGLKVMNPMQNSMGLSFGLGMKAVHFSVEDDSYVVIPLQVFSKIELNSMVYIDGQFGYAPKILSFGDLTSYSEAKVKLNYKMLQDGYIFAGSRYLVGEYENDKSMDIDKSAFVGFEVRF